MTATAKSGPGRPEEDAGGAGLPRWVALCWPRTWREAYGEEMAQTWVDAGATRRSLVPLALQGLRQRVVRPVAAAGVDLGPATVGGDVAVVARPRYLLIGVLAVATAVGIAGLQLGLTWALETMPTAGADESVSGAAEWRAGLIVAVLVGMPLAVAAWGERRTRSRQRRDGGLGLIVGAALAFLLVFVAPAVVTGLTS